MHTCTIEDSRRHNTQREILENYCPHDSSNYYWRVNNCFILSGAWRGSRTTPHQGQFPHRIKIKPNHCPPGPRSLALLPHQDTCPLGPLPRNKTTHQDQYLYSGELSGYQRFQPLMKEKSIFEDKKKVFWLEKQWPEFSTVDYLQINWLSKSVDYNKREISVIQRVQ